MAIFQAQRIIVIRSVILVFRYRSVLYFFVVCCPKTLGAGFLLPRAGSRPLCFSWRFHKSSTDGVPQFDCERRFKLLMAVSFSRLLSWGQDRDPESRGHSRVTRSEILQRSDAHPRLILNTPSARTVKTYHSIGRPFWSSLSGTPPSSDRAFRRSDFGHLGN